MTGMTDQFIVCYSSEVSIWVADVSNFAWGPRIELWSFASTISDARERFWIPILV